MIQRELELRALDGRGQGDASIHLANVASRRSIGPPHRRDRPDVIFHAAAYKHVPMMEEHPSEGVQVNIGGTMAVLRPPSMRACRGSCWSRPTRPSSHRASWAPRKRLAEMAGRGRRRARPAGRMWPSASATSSARRAASCRSSRASWSKGEPITVTHPEMTRYFMTIQEAGWLILDAAAIGRPGDLFVLDMGEPVKIIDMVHDLIRLAGRDVESVPIRFTGLRPGEKLHEKLFYETENVERDRRRQDPPGGGRPSAGGHRGACPPISWQLAYGDRGRRSCGRACSTRWRPGRRWVKRQQSRPMRSICRRSP